MSDSSFYNNLGKSGWNYVGLAAIFSASLLLLFIDKVPSNIGEHLLPALIVFGLGFILLGYIEGTIFRKNLDRDGSEKTKHPYTLLFTANVVWFCAFVIYLFYRGVL